jgi:hypothetical protein
MVNQTCVRAKPIRYFRHPTDGSAALQKNSMVLRSPEWRGRVLDATKYTDARARRAKRIAADPIRVAHDFRMADSIIGRAPLASHGLALKARRFRHCCAAACRYDAKFY